MIKIFLLFILANSDIGVPSTIDRSSLAHNLNLEYKPQLHIFLTTDPEKINASVYLFTNNDPCNFVDRNGQAPIQIAQTVSLENSYKLKAYVQGLTDDVVKLNNNGNNNELRLFKVPENRISRPVGTGLVRSIVENPHDRKIVLDYDNSSHRMIKSGARTAENTMGRIDKSLSFNYTFQNESFQFTSNAFGSVINFERRNYTDVFSTYLSLDHQPIIGSMDEFVPNYIIMGHELVHANRFASFSYFIGLNGYGNKRLTRHMVEHNRRPFPGASSTESANWEELMTIGLTRTSPVNHAREGIDLSSQFSENALRLENNLPLRLSVRPIL